MAFEPFPCYERSVVKATAFDWGPSEWHGEGAKAKGANRACDMVPDGPPSAGLRLAHEALRYRGGTRYLGFCALTACHKPVIVVALVK